MDPSAGAAAAFVAMWIAMMVPMMLPAVGPVLWRDRDRMAMAGVRHPGVLSAIAGVGYFLVWAIVGAAAFPVGAISATALMHEPALARAAPLMVGVTVTMAGAIQLTSWKAHHLAQCRRHSPSGRPSIEMLPRSSGRRPVSARSSVDLPLPFGPATAVSAPGLTSRETPCTTGAGAPG